jgi:hypothetical protein
MPRARKRSSLVCEYLENIIRDAFANHQSVFRSYVRRRQGVYALYRKKKLYYVGLAKDPRTRLRTHVRDRHGASWNRFSVYFTIRDFRARVRGDGRIRFGGKVYDSPWAAGGVQRNPATAIVPIELNTEKELTR